MGEIFERRCWWIVAAIVALGLALRLAAAQGGLWLDEAWSAVMAQEAGTPLGIFMRINHDNNHHLNSLWLQWVGLDAPPMLQRALSIASGTAAIVVAARIGHRRNAATAILCAAFFALSPLLVTYGSEVRGYAPMLFAFLLSFELVDRWLSDRSQPPPALALAIAALLGLLAQLTMAFGLVAIGLWTAWCLRARAAVLFAGLARLWGLATIAAAISLALVFVPAWRAGGMAFGAAEPFSLTRWSAGLFQAFDYGLGGGYVSAAIVVLAGLLLGVPRGRLAAGGYAALLAAPTLVVLAQVPNAGVARLYLTAAAALLLLLALQLGNAYAQGKRVLPTLFAMATLMAMGLSTAIVVRDHRADPGAAIATLASRAPGGADIALDRPRSDAILKAAAATARYRLTLRQACPAARFLFIERDGDEPFSSAPAHCSRRYREIAGDTVEGLSGTQWKLYERSDR